MSQMGPGCSAEALAPLDRAVRRAGGRNPGRSNRRSSAEYRSRGPRHVCYRRSHEARCYDDDAGECPGALTDDSVRSPGASAPGLRRAVTRPHIREETTMHDHRKLGRELGLFDTDPLIGAGLPYWLPDGAAVRHALEEYIRDRRAAGRLPARVLARARQAGAVRDLRALVALQRGHVPADGSRRRAGRPAAEPLSPPRGDLPLPLPQLPRTAPADGRAGRHVPLRAVGRARRADPGPGDPAQRRAHLLHPGPGDRGGAGGAGADPPGVRGARHHARPATGSPCPAPAGSTSPRPRCGGGPPPC